MKYIEEGAKAVHKADLVHLLDTCGVEVQDKDRLNKLTLTNPEAAQQLKLDDKTVSRVREKYACERKIGKIRLAKKMGFKMEKKDDRIRLNMLYRLMKISRREKGFEDVSDIETVSGTPNFKKSSTSFQSPAKSNFSTAAQSKQSSQVKRRSTSPAVKRVRTPQKKTCTSACKQRCQRIPAVLGGYGRRALAFLKNPLQRVRAKRQAKRRSLPGQQQKSKMSWIERSLYLTMGMGALAFVVKEGVESSGVMGA